MERQPGVLKQGPNFKSSPYCTRIGSSCNPATRSGKRADAVQAGRLPSSPLAVACFQSVLQEGPTMLMEIIASCRA